MGVSSNQVVVLLRPMRPRRRAFAYAASLACLVLSLPGFASAATLDSSLVDKTVERTVESVIEGGKSGAGAVAPVRDAVPDPVKEAVKPVTDTVDRATKPVTDRIKDSVTPVTEVVDETVDKVRNGSGSTVAPPTTTDPLAPVGQVTTREPATSDSSAGRQRTDADRRTSPKGREQRGGGSRRAQKRDAVSAPPQEVLPVERSRRTAVRSPAPTTIGGAVAEASRAFRFPLLVAAAVALFLAVQGRLDGRDPKLSARADEELTFA